ncbi:MAG: hypothetical protein Tsb0014_41120 [Pleurocapsa sp.]
MAVLLLNGHNTSQAETMEWLYKRIPRWLKGSETESIMQRVIARTKSQHRRDTIRRLRGWLRIAAEVTKFFPLPEINDNLAVGWFEDTVPKNPVNSGNGFVVRATGAENGELLAKVGNNLLSVFRGLQNVPVYYLVILRERGAAYYAASLPGVYGLPAYPQLRPVAIDPLQSEIDLYPGVHQSVLGQIGFRADTRVYGVKVETIARLANWYGTAQVAALWKNSSTMTAQVGGEWLIVTGNFQLTGQGLMATEANSIAIIQTQTPSGLLHLTIDHEEASASAGIIWRWQDLDNYWCCRLQEDKICLQLIANGRTQVIASWECQTNNLNYLQINDDGQEIGIHLNGQLIGDRFSDQRLAQATGVGIFISQANDSLYLSAIEAHPRTVTIPELNLSSLWWREGSRIIVKDHFTTRGDLAAKTTTMGDRLWSRTIGQGVIAIEQPGIARVQASIEHPNPGRTAYTVAWDEPDADVAVTILPPGKERGRGDKGRGGLIFWQDEDNYIIINTWLDDFYEGESISCFFRIAGFEEIYDAVWSNIGQAIAFGQPYTLRVVFDGNNYTVRVNEQTVLYRALTDVYPWVIPLQINRLGIVVNWEWGNDTGSSFSDFIAKTLAVYPRENDRKFVTEINQNR